MPRRVLYFFPHNLFVAQTGANQRALEMLSALVELGCEVTVFSSMLTSEVAWNGPSSRLAKRHGCHRLVLHQPTRPECAYSAVGKAVYKVLKRWNRRAAGLIEAKTIRSSALCPPSMRALFQNVIDETDPHAIFMHYAFWDGLINHARECDRLRVIDTHDLVSVSMQLLVALGKLTPGGSSTINPIPLEALGEDFFDNLRDSGPRLQMELDIYDRYNVTIAVSSKEADVMKRLRNTSVVTMPTTRSPVFLRNTYSGSPVFAAAANPFNVHGYYYFCRRVLPLLQARVPDFRVNVTGTVCRALMPTERISLLGSLDRLDPIYADAPFFVNPVYGGTGAQVKIVDAMAHGLPVIALDRAAEGSPIKHAVNGLIAKDAREFAEHIATLWSDRRLCRRLGRAARETIAEERSPIRLRESLEQLFRFSRPTSPCTPLSTIQPRVFRPST